MVPEGGFDSRKPHYPSSLGPLGERVPLGATLASGRFIPTPPRINRVDPRDPEAGKRLWWLGHVKPCQELALSSELFGLDVPFLLPLVRHERRTPSGKFRSTERPLFPSYLFISGDEFDRLNAISTGRLVAAIPVMPIDVPPLIADLSALMVAIESEAAMGESTPIRAGQRCRVVGGPLEGQVGTFIREAHRDILLLHVRILSRVVPVEVESWRCELIEDEGDA